MKIWGRASSSFLGILHSPGPGGLLPPLPSGPQQGMHVMYTDLKGKTAFVMGAGKARASVFTLREPWPGRAYPSASPTGDGCVFERARELEAEGVVARAFTADVCSAAQVEAMQDAVGRLFPSIDILIQCAGSSPIP